MKKFNDYEATQKMSNAAPKLPVGGYICKVLNVKFEQFEKFSRLSLAVDIVEGEQKDFFKNRFNSDQNEDKKWKGVINVSVPSDDGSDADAKTKRIFKTVMSNIEESNPGYTWNWDENSLKGKLIGAVFGEIGTCINGRNVTYVGYRWSETVDNIRSGSYKTPEIWFKNGASVPNNILEPANNNEEEIPF